MSLKKFSLIAACCENNGIGINGKLPWRLKSEMNYFSETTKRTDNTNHINAVIMGRSTWNSIPSKFKPLDSRVNVVLSKTLTEKPNLADYLFHSLNKAIEELSKIPNIEHIYIIGGESVYKEAMMNENCEYIYLTRIENNYDCDRFFPEIDLNLFKIDTNFKPFDEIQEENGVKFRYIRYLKIDN